MNFPKRLVEQERGEGHQYRGILQKHLSESTLVWPPARLPCPWRMRVWPDPLLRRSAYGQAVLKLLLTLTQI